MVKFKGKEYKEVKMKRRFVEDDTLAKPKMPRGKYIAEFVKPLNRDYMDKIAEQGQKEAEQNTIKSLVKNSLLHYDMLMSLQTQVLCLEAKIKILTKIVESK